MKNRELSGSEKIFEFSQKLQIDSGQGDDSGIHSEDLF